MKQGQEQRHSARLQQGRQQAGEQRLGRLTKPGARQRVDARGCHGPMKSNTVVVIMTTIIVVVVVVGVVVIIIIIVVVFIVFSLCHSVAAKMCVKEY